MTIFDKGFFKIICINLISYIYLNFCLKIININQFEDFTRNIKLINLYSQNINLGNPEFNIQNIIYFKLLSYLDILLNNTYQSIIIIASFAYSIYLINFIKNKNSIYLFVNFIALPLVPVFFLSINRFALASSIMLIGLKYNNNEYNSKKNYILLLSIIIFGLSIHSSSLIILILFTFDYKKILDSFNLKFIGQLGLISPKNKRTIIFILLLALFYILFLFFLVFSLNISDIFYQFNYIKKCFIEDCQTKYSIFILPFSYFLILTGIKNRNNLDKEKKSNIYIYLTFTSIITILNPLFWRFWIPLIPVLSNFSRKNVIIPNLILGLYEIYLLPKYII